MGRELQSTFVKRIRRIQTRRLQGFPKEARYTRKQCPSGTIMRSPYVRIRRGTRSYVAASCIPNVGAPGKGLSGSDSKGIGPLRHGDLKRFGYVHTLTDGRRHIALAKAVASYGSLSVWRKLNAIYIYTRRTSPVSSAAFKRDRDWIKETYGI